MPWPRRRALLCSELDTAPRMRSGMRASASMKQFTVEPVPTPITLPGCTWPVAACPTRALSSSCVIRRLSTRADHVLGLDPGIELLAGDPARSERGIAQAAALLVRGLRDLRGLVVADVRV